VRSGRAQIERRDLGGIILIVTGLAFAVLKLFFAEL